MPTDALLELLRCPSTGQRLIRVSDSELVTTGRDRSYPVVDGVPVLIVEERSVFRFADYVSQDGARPHAPSMKDRLLVRTQRLLPSVAANIGSRENYARLGRLLAGGSGVSPARVLVVGGSIAGKGFDALLEGQGDLELYDLDPAIGPRTSVVADAHDLPFAAATFDAVVCQAVLEHVADPPRVVAEMHRVLRPDGLAYSEIPFMQQVHEGAYDFTRYTLTGHRRLFRCFDEIDAGCVAGPGSALAWSLKYFARSFGGRSRVLRGAFGAAAQLLGFWLKYLDHFLLRSPAGSDAAAGTFFLGRRRDSPIPDAHIVETYRGAGADFTFNRA